MRFMAERELDESPDSYPGDLIYVPIAGSGLRRQDYLEGATEERALVLLSCAERIFAALAVPDIQSAIRGELPELDGANDANADDAFDAAESFLKEAIRRGYVP